MMHLGLLPATSLRSGVSLVLLIPVTLYRPSGTLFGEREIGAVSFECEDSLI